MPAALTPQTFVAKWRPIELHERVMAYSRDAWLNPVQTFEVSGQPEVGRTSKVSRERTLTNLYNARPTWLDHAHRKLDAAVFAAYGWPATLSDEEILARLLALNLARATSTT